MTRTEAAIAQNQAILLQLLSHLGLPTVPPHTPTQTSAAPPPAGSAPSPSAPADSLDVLEAAAASATPPAASQPAQVEDDSPIEEVPLPPLTSGSVAGRVSVRSDVHTFDFSFTCTTCSAKPIFVC